MVLTMKRTATVFLLLAVSISPVFTQVRESAGGGGATAMGGAGRAYEAAGKSLAARDLQRKMNSTLLRAIAKEKAATSSRRKAAQAGAKVSRRPAPIRGAPPPVSQPENTSAFFKPQTGADVNTFQFIAESMSEDKTEQEVFKLIFQATKDSFEQEVANKGRSNNVAAAFTLFIATSLTVYHDTPEPSDAAMDVLWDGLGSALAETPELAKMSDSEKGQIYDTLIALSGILLAGYVEGKKPENKGLAATTRQAAGTLFETVLQTDPSTMRFTATGLETIK